MNMLMYFLANLIGRCVVGVVSVALFGPIAMVVLPLQAVRYRRRDQPFRFATELRNLWFWWEVHRPLGFESSGVDFGRRCATTQEKDREQSSRHVPK